MKAPEIIRMETRHWWEEFNTLDEMKEKNIVCFSFGNRRLRKIPYTIKEVNKDAGGKVIGFVMERYITPNPLRGQKIL